MTASSGNLKSHHSSVNYRGRFQHNFEDLETELAFLFYRPVQLGPFLNKADEIGDDVSPLSEISFRHAQQWPQSRLRKKKYTTVKKKIFHFLKL